MHAMVFDSRELMRQTLGSILSSSVPCLKVSGIGSVGGLIKQSLDPVYYDLIVGSPASFGSESGTCVALVKRLYPDAKVVLLHDEPLDDDEETRARVTALPTTVGALSLKNHIKRLVNIDDDEDSEETSQPFSFELGSETVRPAVPMYRSRPHLSKRQRQIMVLVATGLGNIEISERLGIAEGTVKSHMHTIFRALNVRSRTQAVIKYQKLSEELN